MPESFLIKLHVQAFNFITKETLAQLFSCEFWEISKNTFFTEHLWATASDFFKSMMAEPGLKMNAIMGS